MNAVDHVKSALTEAQSALAALIENEATLESIAQAAHAIAESQRQGGAVYSCGNGGSLCDAMHFAEEMTGRYRQNRFLRPATVSFRFQPSSLPGKRTGI